MKSTNFIKSPWAISWAQEQRKPSKMSKTDVTILVAIMVAVVFLLGTQVGIRAGRDHGYNSGFNAGYQQATDDLIDGVKK